ncbi:Anti-Sigma-factor antagonist (STAS) domain protein [Arcticibacter svalbardensis MN12-7]|uniref:Anti-Sigma-factor antagonist (STAS) domain protein n=1 Tax=Arcticibacter svalbardensis MN12-7 TaxID=1150600 RepID=R9GX30_9SPHI|nr:STAS domain-containing protein [Arcticibacter svalbardensis]EOR96065.1 Anti-Sigma-factor antagonist (STAS) domain protein [Arcticibacter svalbardensis MN12-7]
MIEITTHQNYYIAKIKFAEANMEQSDLFKQEIINELDSGHTHILISFENVNYIDSSFLGALVTSLKHAMAMGGDIAVYGLNENISQLFELIRMNKVFKVFKDLPGSYQAGWIA